MFFLKPFFRVRENFFQRFRTNFCYRAILRDVIGLENFILSFSKAK